MEAVEFIQKCETQEKWKKIWGSTMSKSKMQRKLFVNQGRARENPRKFSVHCGTSVENSSLEESLYGWITESRFAEILFRGWY